MNTSAIVRIIIGAALLVFTGFLYSSNRSSLDAGHGLELFGRATSISASQALWIYAAAGLIGIGFIAVGATSILRNKR